MFLAKNTAITEATWQQLFNLFCSLHAFEHHFR